ncbi:hypothetical protein SSX86_018182 [Deinandra increscens subsp. villosa]|uniref:Uncharacterized protein n=1 Tax=Deinandra increscens subsp. villosa TaxID=3103831 RepID=A0AAP0GUF6_9ASTR
MDIDISGWIIEFLLRQNSLDDQTLNKLIRVLPLPNHNPSLKKSFILRKLESDISKGAISERTIEYLEQIEELNHIEGITEVSESMKAAYSTVAMHCTIKLIEESAGDKKTKYDNAVKRFWSARVCEMERCSVGLVHDDLVRWVHDVEAGNLDIDVCENVVQMFEELDVLKTVRRYVNEEKEKMGPSFLELACELILNDDALSEAMGLDEVSELRSAPNDVHDVSKGNEALGNHDVSKFSNQSKESAPTEDAGANSKGNEALGDHEVSKLINQSKESAPTDDGGGNGKGNEALKAHVLPRHKNVISRRHRGAKLVDPMETSHDRYDFIPSPEVRKVREALESSSFDLHAMVKDPLPDALRLAESLKVSTSGENEAHAFVGGDTTNVNDKDPNSTHDRKGKALEGDGDDDIIKDQNRKNKPNLFERNSTAHTTEWSDSIDTSDEGSPTRPRLPSPQRSKVSPLSVYKMKKLARQRKKKRWTTLEEDTLRTGVQKYGRGNWKLILSIYRDIFEDRTEVDLKDKWRNLTR